MRVAADRFFVPEDLVRRRVRERPVSMRSRVDLPEPEGTEQRDNFALHRWTGQSVRDDLDAVLAGLRSRYFFHPLRADDRYRTLGVAPEKLKSGNHGGIDAGR